MKHCEKCKIDIVGQSTYCPLCQSELTRSGEGVDEAFPIVSVAKAPYYLLLKTITFIGIAGSISSVFLNTIFYPEVWWSLYIVITLICGWVSVAMAISRYKNIAKYVLQQSMIFCVFALFMDYFTGWSGWSTSLVIPVVLTLAMVVLSVLSKVLHLQPGDYMIYLLIDAAFGIIPIIFIGSDSVITDIPSLICIVVSIVSVTRLVVFEGRMMYSELKRRLHV